MRTVTPPPVSRRGVMLVLSSPSGAGKTTISRSLLAQDPHITMSVSCTTRKPRSGEEDGKDYHFISAATFDQMVAEDQFLEHARVFDHHYGTPRAAAEQILASGHDVLFDIDWQGTQQLGQNAPSDLVTVFVLPPSMEELERRLRARAQDPEEVVKKRMAKAGDEMSHWFEYDYIILNTDIETSIAGVQSILSSERLKRDRQVGMASFVNLLRGQ